MIIDSFDESPAVIFPKNRDDRVKCDVIIPTFSNEIEKYVIQKFNAKQIGDFVCANGNFPIYCFEYEGKIFGFYKTFIGAAMSVAMLEDALTMIDCKKVIVFGSAGTLDKKCYGKVMVPTFAYRDEGTSYHYAKADDYIEIKNANLVADFMKRNDIPFEMGRCWTTDAFFRETENNLKARQNDGCIAVDMECSAMQALSNFRNLKLYYFFLSGDLLDSPEWVEEGLNEANHGFKNFDIALRLGLEI